MYFKNFRHKKLHITMIIFIVLLCSTLICGSFSLLITLENPIKELKEECNSADANVFPYYYDENQILEFGREIEELEEVDRVEFADTYFLQDSISYKDTKIEAFINLMEYHSVLNSSPRIIEGSIEQLKNLKDGECFLPACIANAQNMKLEDQITFIINETRMTYTVKGIYTDPYNISKAFDTYIIINKLPSNVTPSKIMFLYGEQPDQVEDAYRAKHDGQFVGELVTLEDRTENNLLANQITGAIFLAIGFIMMIVGGVIIYFILKNTMIQDAKKIAIYKTIGYSSANILKMYSIFYFIIISIASIAGTFCSILLSKPILKIMFANLGQPLSNNILLPGIFCYFIVILFVQGIIIITINRSKNIKPVYALSGMIQSNTQKHKEFKGNTTLQFSAFGIAIRTMLRDKRGVVGFMIISLFTVFSINFGIISLDVANSMKNNNDFWFGIDKCDVMISIENEDQYLKAIKILDNHPDVKNILSSNLNTKVTLKWEKGMSHTAMSGMVYENYENTELSIVEGRNIQTANEIMISSKIADELKKTVGDYISIYLNGEDKVDLLICGIFQSYYDLGYTCRLRSDTYYNNNSRFQFTNISVYLNNGSSREKFIKELKQELHTADIIKREDMFKSIMEMIAEPQQKSIPLVVILTLLIGGINIASIVVLKNSNYEKINAIYKSIGYSTGHLVKANLCYVVLIAVVSLVISLPLTIAFYPDIMKLALSSFGLRVYPVDYNAVHLIIINGIILFIFILSTLISSYSLKHIDVKDLVQD